MIDYRKTLNTLTLVTAYGSLREKNGRTNEAYLCTIGNGGTGAAPDYAAQATEERDALDAIAQSL